MTDKNQQHTKHAKALNVHPLLVNGPSGRLEALRSHPTPPIDHKKIAAIICHPHPLYGGNFNNKVVYTLAKSFHQLDIPTIRFNFRGVGRSQGEYDNGQGELDDLVAIADYTKQHYPNHAIYLAGFSFGAYIAIKATQRLKPSLLITVAPPINIFDFTTLSPPLCSWLLIQGLEDEIVDSNKVIEWSNQLNQPPTLITMDGVGHFFHGQLNTLQNRLLQTLSAHIPSNNN